MRDNDFEYLITKRAWADPDFAARLEINPSDALAELGVTVPDGVKIKVVQQKAHTLYFTIPPIDPAAAGQEDFELTQMDLWSSGKMFVWIAPSRQKVKLLRLRNSVREGR